MKTTLLDINGLWGPSKCILSNLKINSVSLGYDRWHYPNLDLEKVFSNTGSLRSVAGVWVVCLRKWGSET